MRKRITLTRKTEPTATTSRTLTFFVIAHLNSVGFGLQDITWRRMANILFAHEKSEQTIKLLTRQSSNKKKEKSNIPNSRGVPKSSSRFILPREKLLPKL